MKTGFKLPDYFTPQRQYKKENFIENPAEIKEFIRRVNAHSVVLKNKGQLMCPVKVLNPKLLRTLDLVTASILSIPAAFLLGGSAVVLKITAPASKVFHKQSRFGKNGVRYVVYKLRTVEKTPDGWRMSSKFAKLLRRYSIDELPQIMNVFKGEMSFMGPRSLLYLDLKKMTEENGMDFMARRFSMKPGFGFGYEKQRTLPKPRAEMEKDLFNNQGFRAYAKTLKNLAVTMLKGNNA